MAYSKSKKWDNKDNRRGKKPQRVVGKKPRRIPVLKTIDRIQRIPDGKIKRVSLYLDWISFYVLRETPQNGRSIHIVSINTPKQPYCFGVASEQFKAIKANLEKGENYLVFTAESIDQNSIETKVDLRVPGIKYKTEKDIIEIFSRGTTLCKIQNINAPKPGSGSGSGPDPGDL